MLIVEMVKHLIHSYVVFKCAIRRFGSAPNICVNYRIYLNGDSETHSSILETTKKL